MAKQGDGRMVVIACHGTPDAAGTFTPGVDYHSIPDKEPLGQIMVVDVTEGRERVMHVYATEGLPHGLDVDSKGRFDLWSEYKNFVIGRINLETFECDRFKLKAAQDKWGHRDLVDHKKYDYKGRCLHPGACWMTLGTYQ